MNRLRLASAGAALVAALAACGTAAALTTPGRTVATRAPVTSLALTGTSVAFAVDRSRTDCYHVELWNTATRGLWRFGAPGRCRGDEPSTGRGIAEVALASKRVVWIAFAGGNNRDWLLYTATPTSRTPRLLRFVTCDVDAPAPVVVGEGTAEGVPYAVDGAVTYLADNGSAVFRASLPSPVRLIAAGKGLHGARVATVLANGHVVLLSRSGTVVDDRTFAPGEVSAVRLAPSGVVLQRGGLVERRDGARVMSSRALPKGGQMLDYAEGRVLYSRGGQLRTLRLATGTDALLVAPYLMATPRASLDPRGLAWARGPSVNWACAVCLDFGA